MSLTDRDLDGAAGETSGTGIPLPRIAAPQGGGAVTGTDDLRLRAGGHGPSTDAPGVHAGGHGPSTDAGAGGPFAGISRVAGRGAGRPAYLPFVAALSAATFLQWLGAGAVLPLLPIYLRRHGTSDAMVGAVMAAFFAAGVLAQYAGGRLGDRIGHKRVLLLGLVGYAAASAGFLLPLTGWGYVALRAGQGAAAGAAQVAVLALVTRAVPVTVRGRAISAVYGGELGGVAIGPLVGTLVGVPHMAGLFLVAAGGALVAGVPVLLARTHVHPVVLGPDAGGSGSAAGPDGLVSDGVVPDGLVLDGVGPDRSGSGGTGSGGATGAEPEPAGRQPWRGPAGRVLVGVMLSAVAGGLLTGIYETCWTLLLDHRHAEAWQIGASWTLFALPFVIGAPVAGWVADQYDRRWLVLVAMVVSVGFALGYPWVASVDWLIGLGAAESLGVVFAVPAAQSLLGQAAPPELIGRAQGLFASIQTAAIAAAAAGSGALFAIAPWWPFTAGAVLSLTLTALLPWVWRGVPGRVRAAR